MARKPKALVLDSWSILAYLEDEPAGQQVADIIADAHESDTPLMMTVVNAGEIWYITARETSEDDADRTIMELAQLGIQFSDADWKLAREAARFKAKDKMSFADCFAAALAKENKADLVTGDLEFKQVEGEVKIHWL
jgi:predicted nucleic acid-binding protein